MNYFEFSDSNKRYHTLDYFYKHKFGKKVFKVSLNAGFTCPNIDGKVGLGGCIYCSNTGSGEYAGNVNDNLIKQFESVSKIILKKWPDSYYIGYFQAHTNTYAPLPILKEKYEMILNLPNVVGLSIATRCDCLESDTLDYLEDLNKRTFLTIELGLQTIHTKTSDLINRCHDLTSFENMVKELKKRNIFVVVHIINGLPYETKDMMIETVKYLNNLNIDGIKIHMLNIIENTKLADMYKEKPFPLLSKREYVEIVVDQLEHLNKNIVVQRLTGDAKLADLIEPTWTSKKLTVLNDIDKCLEKRQTYQGFKLDINNEYKRLISKNLKSNDLVINFDNEISSFIETITNNIISNYENYENKISLIVLTNQDPNDYKKFLNKKGHIIIKEKTIIEIKKDI